MKQNVHDAPSPSGGELAGNDDATAIPRRIPMAQPWIGDRERELVAQVLSSDVLALGRFAETFEEQVAALVDRKFGVACSSGTAGLRMAIRALGIADGDEVITSPFSFVASADSLLYERAVPSFVDIDNEPWDSTPILSPRPRGLEPRAFCLSTSSVARARSAPSSRSPTSRGWHLIEDACEALGSSTHGRPAGSPYRRRFGVRVLSEQAGNDRGRWGRRHG